MSSIVFYKFLHQKNKLVVHFDGTAINVFDLKREIIIQNQLGTGQDFNLKLYYSEQPNLEYELDQDIVPRSSFVLVKRSPAQSRNRFNNALRYVTGKPRANRKVRNGVPITTIPTKTETRPMNDNVSEEDRIKMMFENQSNVWAQTQEELAQHKAIHFKPSGKTGISVTEDLPPPGYICYRCGKKDHWIKNCPTNDDPNFEGKKILRTTGIPKLYLKTISKEDVENQAQMDAHGLSTNEHGDIVDKDGNAVLITDDGDYAIAMADSRTWLSYQEKQKNAVFKAKQDFEKRILECVDKEQKIQFLDPLAPASIPMATDHKWVTKKLLISPIVMTPCCRDMSSLKTLKNFNYNQSDLENLLIENDFHCPNCDKEDVFLDSLVSNPELEQELEAFIQEMTAKLGISDPYIMVDPNKRPASDGLDETLVKKQRIDSILVNAMPPIPFGMPMAIPGMPMAMPGIMPMMMPPPSFPTVSNYSKSGSNSKGN